MINIHLVYKIFSALAFSITVLMKSTEQIPGPASVKQETHHMLHAVSNSYPISFTPPT